MNDKETKQQMNKPSEAIEDLAINEDEAGEVKGGPNWPSVKMLDSVVGNVTEAGPNPDIAGYDLTKTKKI